MTLLEKLGRRSIGHALSIYCAEDVYKESLTALYFLYYEWHDALLQAKEPLMAQIRLTWWRDFFDNDTMINNAPEAGRILHDVTRNNILFKEALKNVLESLEEEYIHYSLQSGKCTEKLLYSAMALCDMPQEQIEYLLYSSVTSKVPFKIRHIFIPQFLEGHSVGVIQRLCNIFKLLWFYMTGYGRGNEDMCIK